MECKSCEHKDRCWKRMVHGDQADCEPVRVSEHGEITFSNQERLEMIHLLSNGMFAQHDFVTVNRLLDRLYR